MIIIGRINTLIVSSVEDSGVWFESDEDLRISKKELHATIKPGDRVEAFVYRDSTGVLMATTRIPLGQVGDFVPLRVNSLTKHGAFLDIGMKKDLLVPFTEQQDRMQDGRYYVVRIILDEEERLLGSTRLDHYLETLAKGLTVGQEVDLIVWQFSDLGAKVIVNNQFEALVYRDEITPGIKIGSVLKGYIQRIRADHKIDVSLRKTGKEGIDDSINVVLNALKSDGFIPLHDKSDPDEIRKILGISKKGFKRAIGGLYKNGTIEMTEGGIKLKS